MRWYRAYVYSAHRGDQHFLDAVGTLFGRHSDVIGLYYIKNLDSVTHKGDFSLASLPLARMQTTSSYTINTRYTKLFK